MLSILRSAARELGYLVTLGLTYLVVWCSALIAALFSLVMMTEPSKSSVNGVVIAIAICIVSILYLRRLYLRD